MKLNFVILLSLMFNINMAQNKQCSINYNFIDDVFHSKSIENLDSQLSEKGYIFNFNTTYTNYWNAKEKINFNIYWDEQKSQINFINIEISSFCYEDLKEKIISLGFKKVYEKMLKSRIDLYYNKDEKYIILGKVNTNNLTENTTKNGFDISMISESKYYELIKK